MSESDSGSVDKPRHKKGRVNKEKHVCEMEKLARHQGEELVTSAGVPGVLVLVKTTEPN